MLAGLWIGVFFIAALSKSADFYPPAAERYAKILQAGSILPGGRLLQPLGLQIDTGSGPFGLAVGPKGVLATADIGSERLGITVMAPPKNAKTGSWMVHHLWAKSRRPGADADDTDPEWKGVFFGLAFEGERNLWAAEGDSGKIRLVDVQSGQRRKVVDLNGGPFQNSYSGDLVYDPQRQIVWVLDQANFRLCGVDAKTGTLLSSVAVGRMPFAVAISPDGKTGYVTNTGTFRYHVLAGADAKDLKRTGIPFPAFGFPSKQALDGTVSKSEAVDVAVPGLGDPNVPESNSVSIIDLSDPLQPVLRKFVKTGRPYSASSAGGAAPSGVVATAEHVFVSNAHDDSITVLRPDGNIEKEIQLQIPSMERLRGIMPAGMAFDPVTKWLLVAEAGINAVGVVDVEKGSLLGHLPVGWMPVRVAVSEGQVVVSNARGKGAGPHVKTLPALSATQMPLLRGGSVSIFKLPAATELTTFTARVFTSNGFVPKYEPRPPLPAGIKHVMVIVKENRTFDEVLGDMPRTGGKDVAGFPQMAVLGMKATARGRANRDAPMTQFSLKDVPVTPNHHAIAAQFAFSDNFYADSDVSVDGHHWIVGSYPDLFTESSLLASYGGNRKFALDDKAPGRLQFPGSDSSVHTDEQPEAGTLWHHLERNKISFRNYGEGFELAGLSEDKDLEPTGARFGTNVAMPDPLFRNTSRTYPGFNMKIPDQYRVDRFLEDMEARYGSGKEPLPQFLFMHLPNDHMDQPRPDDGYPYDLSYVADNDLALGRVLEYLSHKPWWKDMAVFVTEDDAQGGYDHVDFHRTVLLAAGPWVKRNYVSHTNVSFPGLLKTVFELLRIPPLNLMDASAPDLRDLFAAKPDEAPYKALPPDLRVFDPAKARVGTGKSILMDRP